MEISRDGCWIMGSVRVGGEGEGPHGDIIHEYEGEEEKDEIFCSI